MPMKSHEKGKLLVISGPSGAGKSTVIGRLMEQREDLCFSVSVTTRAPRPGEEDGRDYFFVSPQRFQELVEDGYLLEHAEYSGNCYGTPRAAVERHIAEGRDVVLEIEVQGAMQIKKKRPDAVMVFIAPPSFEELASRLRGRGTETEESIQERLATARQELAEQDKFTVKLVNNQIEPCAAELYQVICQRAGLQG